jgi:hypothetical protein
MSQCFRDRPLVRRGLKDHGDLAQQQRKLMAFAGDGIDRERERALARFPIQRIEPKSAANGRI